MIYAQLINGDLIQRQIRKAVPPGDVLGAAAVTDPATNSALPLVDVVSLAHARLRRPRGSLEPQPTSSGRTSQINRLRPKIPPNQRVLLQVVSTKSHSGRRDGRRPWRSSPSWRS